MNRENHRFPDEDDDEVPPPPPPPPTLEVLTQTVCMKSVLRYLDSDSRRCLACTSAFYWSWYRRGFEKGEFPKLMADGRANQSQKVRQVQLLEPPTKAVQAELAEVDLVRSASSASQKSGKGKCSRGPSIIFKPMSSSSSSSTTSSIKPISAIKRVFVNRSASKTSTSSLHANEMDASAIPYVPPISDQSPQKHEQWAATNVVHIPSISGQSLENHRKPSEDNLTKTPVSIASTQQPQRQPKVVDTPLTSSIMSDLMAFQQASMSYLETNSHTHANAPKHNNYDDDINKLQREECNHTRNIQTMRQPPLLGFSHSRSYEEQEEEPFDQMAPPLKSNPPPTNVAKTADPSCLPDQGAVSSPKPSKPVLILGSPTRGSSFDSGIGAEPTPRLSLSHDTRNQPISNNHGKEGFHHHHSDVDDTTTPSESESTSLSSKPVLLLGAAGRPKSNLMPPTPVVVTPPRSSRAGLEYSNLGGDSHFFGIDRVGSKDGSRSRSRSRSQSRNRYEDGNRFLFRDDILPLDDSEEDEEDLSREERYSRRQRRHQREQGAQSHVRERRHSREPTTQRKGTAHSNSDTRPSGNLDMFQQLADAALFDAPKILAEAPMVFSNYMNGLIDKANGSQKGNGFDGSAGTVADGGVAGATNGSNGGDKSYNGKENNSKESDDGSNNSNSINEENKHEELEPTPEEAATSSTNTEVQSEYEEVAPAPKSTTNPKSPRQTRARSPDIFEQLTDAALFNMMDAPAVFSRYVNGIFAGNNHDEEEDENNMQEETLDSLILRGFQNYGEHDPNSSEVTLEDMIFSGFTSGLDVVPRMETEEVLTEAEIDEKIMSGLVKGKIIDLAVEKYYNEASDNEATAKKNADKEVDDQWPIQIGNKLYTHEEAMQMWMRAKKKSGEVSSEDTIPEDRQALKDAILAQLMADRLREYKRVNEEKFGRLGLSGPMEDEIEERGFASRHRYTVGLKRGRHFAEGGLRRSRSPNINRNGNRDGDVKRNGNAHGNEIDNGGGSGKKVNADTDLNATTMNDNGIANRSANAYVSADAHRAGIINGGDNSHDHGARQSLVRFQGEEEPVSNPHEVSTPKQTSNKKSPARPVSLDRLMTEFQYKKDVTKYDDETTEVADNARRNIAANSVSSNISAKKLFREEEAESVNVSAKDTPFHHSISKFRQRQEAIIEEIIRKTYVEDTPKTENKTVPSPPISTKEANTVTIDSSPAKDSVLGSNYGVEVSSIHGINPRFVTNSKTGKGGESFLGSQFGTEVVVKPEKLVTERKPRTLASHNMNVRGNMSRLSVKGFGGARHYSEGGKTKGVALEGKSTLPPPISEVKVKTKKTNPLKKLGIKKSSKA